MASSASETSITAIGEIKDVIDEGVVTASDLDGNSPGISSFVIPEGSLPEGKYIIVSRINTKPLWWLHSVDRTLFAKQIVAIEELVDDSIPVWNVTRSDNEAGEKRYRFSHNQRSIDRGNNSRLVAQVEDDDDEEDLFRFWVPTYRLEYGPGVYTVESSDSTVAWTTTSDVEKSSTSYKVMIQPLLTAGSPKFEENQLFHFLPLQSPPVAGKQKSTLKLPVLGKGKGGGGQSCIIA
ncbi:hypothetical protein TWF694_005138 [Orbilia ellipsospora]|uniref:Uncharacterized protein n=1 Tax=Orbilia ellipsospora TaxID=2528407 RepID=A0AAV9WX86_9PEZI